jgi:hypothetical protein
MGAANRWTSLPAQKGLDGGGEYSVIDPYSIYRGRSYSDWTCDWFNYFLSADADKRNSGPVVFLRSHGLPNKITGAYTSDLPDSHSTDPNYPKVYVNDPNIRIGSDRLRIFEDQAVFVPICVAYLYAHKIGEQYLGTSYVDLGILQEYTGMTMDYGDNPVEPSQLTINNSDVELLQGLKMEDFRITTPIFTAVVPDAQYGTSIKDFLEEGSVAPGSYPAVVEGYFVMLKFKAPGSYWVHSWASAGREVRGPYFTELVYQIEVDKRPKCDPHGKITTNRPAKYEAIFKRTLFEKQQIGELTDDELNRFKEIYNALSKKKLK